MKQSEAVEHLRTMMRVVQRFRGISKEALVGGGWKEQVVDSLLADIQPYIFGNKCVLEALIKILDSVDAGNALAPHDFYNMIYIAGSLEPSIGAACQLSGRIRFPLEADYRWVLGWEPEEQTENNAR